MFHEQECELIKTKAEFLTALPMPFASSVSLGMSVSITKT